MGTRGKEEPYILVASFLVLVVDRVAERAAILPAPDIDISPAGKDQLECLFVVSLDGLLEGRPREPEAGPVHIRPTLDEKLRQTVLLAPDGR